MNKRQFKKFLKNPTRVWYKGTSNDLLKYYELHPELSFNNHRVSLKNAKHYYMVTVKKRIKNRNLFLLKNYFEEIQDGLFSDLTFVDIKKVIVSKIAKEN